MAKENSCTNAETEGKFLLYRNARHVLRMPVSGGTLNHAQLNPVSIV